MNGEWCAGFKEGAQKGRKDWYVWNLCTRQFTLPGVRLSGPVPERMMQLGVLNIKLGSMQRRNSTQRTERTAGSGRAVM